MHRFALTAIAILFLLPSCKHKEFDLAGDKPVKAKDFLSAFTALTLPYYAADTNIAKIADTTLISRAVFTQFIPDSALQKFITADGKLLKINPVGSITKQEEQYLLATISQGKKIALIAFVLDKKEKYQAALQLLANRNNDGYLHAVDINREPTFTISRQKGAEGSDAYRYTRNGYAYNNGSGLFIKVVDDSNEGKAKNDSIINPIDTLARKNKLSGDYAANKKNFISIRDGRNSNNYTFFIHFEKNEEDGCNGELKGEMNVNGEHTAIYQQSGDPCEIDFTFKDGEIVVKERGNCGNHRGIKCYFDDTWPKKKVKKPKKSSE